MHEISSEANDYNLNITRYIDSSEPEDLQDLEAHIHGGIPERDIEALKPYWDAFPQLRTTLFKPNRPGYADLAIDPSAGPADHPRLGRVQGVHRERPRPGR